MKKRYEWYEYEVWGDEKEGWRVNDIWPTGDEFEIDDEWSRHQLISHLRRHKFFKRGVREKDVEVEWWEDVIGLSYKGRPEGEFRPLDEEEEEK